MATFQDELRRGDTPTQDLETFIDCAIDAAVDYFGDSEEWKTPEFHLVRLLKDHPALVGRSASVAWASAAEFEWWNAFSLTEDEAEVAFFKVWMMSTISPRLNPLATAWEKVRKSTFTLSDAIMANRPIRYPEFVALAGWLQVTMGARPVLLPVEKVGAILNVSPRTISTYIDFAIKDGFLRRTRAYVHRQKGATNRAAEYLFNIERFNGPMRRAAAEGTAELFASAKHVEHGKRRSADPAATTKGDDDELF